MIPVKDLLRIFLPSPHGIDVNAEIYKLARGSVAIVLACCIVGAETAAPVVIQLRVMEGDGAVYGVGSRAARGLSVQVSDETGKPVEGAAVSFQLPGDGPGGVFSTGGRTEIVTTKSDGVAAIWGMQWNKAPGAFEIRVTASKGQARAGLAVTQYLSDTVKSGGEGTFTASHHSRNKWLIIGAAAGGAVAGLALRGSSSKSAAAAAQTTVPLQIGNPSLIVGHP
jgi:hypothetical protein